MHNQESRALHDALEDSQLHDVPEDIVIVDENLERRVSEEALTSRVPDVTVLPPVDEREREGEQDTLYTQSGEESRYAPPVLVQESQRDTVRLLICTESKRVLEAGSLEERRLRELGGLFGEIHVIILSVRDGKEEPLAIRQSENIWIYTTASAHPLMTPYDAYRIAGEQLTFGGGFRADIVIAEDPFASLVAAQYIAKKYERPHQLHLFEDIFDPEWKERDSQNWLRLLVARHLLRRVPAVRTQNENVRRELVQAFPELESRTEVFPLYFDLRGWRDMTPSFDLRERYPRFKFIILHISSMRPRSHTNEVIDGVLPLLNLYPTIGLVIVGSGPLRGAIEKKVSTLGMAGKIVFEPAQVDVVSHMKSSHVLIHLSEDSEEDLTILQAASVRLPLITLGTGIAGTLFKDGESAFLCASPDPNAVSRYLRMFLNDNSARLQLASHAEEVVFERVEQDYEAYLRAYRASIEKSLG